MADEEEEAIDFYGLRKRLSEEYTFINHQKREIQNEYSTIVSTGDSLFRNLWVNGQQWKNLLRLKGGPKFSSECVYAANLLDSISFVDGYMRVGFKEVKYGSFLKALKDNTAVVKSILIVADDMNLETSAFLRTILISLYGSCLFPADQKAVLRIAKCLIEYHLVFSKAPLAIFRGERNSFSNILEEILQTSCTARGFLVSACKETIMNILLDGKMFWTLEEQELLSVMDVSKVRQKFGDPGSPGTTERIRGYMDQSWSKLIETVNTILTKVEESLDCLPDMFLLVVSYFYVFSKNRGFSDHQAQIIVLRFLFNQVITPSLLKPQPLLLDMEVRASNIALFNLRKVVEILKTLISIEAGDGQLNLSEESKTFYDKVDRGPLYKVVDSLLKKVPAHSESLLQLDEDEFPGIARTSVLITKKDLDSLILLLTKLQQIASLPKEPKLNPQHATERLLDLKSLQTILGHLDGIDQNVTSSLANLSLSTRSLSGLQAELHDIFQTFNEPFVESEEVMVISLGVTTVDCPGMLPEEKILGMPTPKVKRKPIPTLSNITDPDETFDTSQLSDSDSNESSSDEKPSESKPEAEETIEAGEDVVNGFENSFVDFPNDTFPTQEQTSENPDPFKIFDTSPPTTVSDQNDPFLTVVSSLWRPPRPPTPPGNQKDVLVDLGDPVDSSSIPTLHHASPTLTSKPLASDAFRNSSGSQSSTDRHSSTASSGSDGTFVQSHHRILQRDSPLIAKDKKVTRKKSLKNLHDVLSSQLGAKREKKKKSGRYLRNKMRILKKNSDALLDANDVATIIAAGADQEKTAKDICDEIISKYVKVKRVRSVSSLPDKANEPEEGPSPDDTTSSLDEEDMVKDAKHKLRYVLSCGSNPVLPFPLNECSRMVTKSENSSSTLLSYLKRDLADAVANQNPTMIARLHETLNATANLSSARHPQLLRELQAEYHQRRVYISYLVRTHQGLMCTRAFLDNMLKRVERDREICRRFLMTQCVAMYMNDCKEAIELFVRKFQRLSMSDEKSEEMKTFLQHLKEEFQDDSLWLGSNEKQKCEIMDAVERFVIGRVYLYALYAFGETDKFRDDVFHDSVEFMCNSIGDNFTALDIKEEYQREAPWFPAQYELFTLAAYKTPVDKLKCIQRCCTTIMALLGMSSGSGAVGADAFTPVLIYVVMHANPRGLLTTVDFINSYLGEPLTGEQYYCWMQFCSAIQFIKILLEENKSNET